MRNYIKLHGWNFLLTVLIAVGMHLNTFSAFMIKESYMTNYPLVFVVTTAVMALMYVIGYDRRNTILGAAGWVLFLLGWIIYLRVNDLIDLTEGADETIPAFWTIVLFGTAAIYLLTRSRKVLYAAAPVGLLFCGIFRFLEYPVSTLGLFLFVAALLMEILFLTYKDSLLTAAYGNYRISHFVMQSIAIATVVIMLATGVFYGIVKPLDPPTQDLKLITRLMQFDILELLGVASTQEVRDPNQDNDEQDDDDPPDEEEEEKDEDEKDNEEDETKESDEKIDASTMSYKDRDHTVYWVTALIVLALAAPFVVKYALRARRRRRLSGLDASNQAAFVYDFFLDRLKRLGIGKSDDQTVLEYAELQEGVLENFTAADGTTFSDISEIFSHFLYSKVPVTEDEAKRFLAMYDSFYKNARAFTGPWRYLLKFWVL